MIGVSIEVSVNEPIVEVSISEIMKYHSDTSFILYFDLTASISASRFATIRL
jgi:hypothetical protein